MERRLGKPRRILRLISDAMPRAPLQTPIMLSGGASVKVWRDTWAGGRLSTRAHRQTHTQIERVDEI